MFDILLYIFESYFDIGTYPDQDRLSVKLAAAGFGDDDIEDALSWISGLNDLDEASYPSAILSSSIRLYSEFELQYLSTEGCSFIYYLEQNHYISAIDREMILDRIFALQSSSLPIEKVKLVSLLVLWNQHEYLDPILIEDLISPAENLKLH